MDNVTKRWFCELLRDLKRDVDDFRQYWADNNHTDPDNFPLKLEAGEFFEQFLIFLNLQWNEEE